MRSWTATVIIFTFVSIALAAPHSLGKVLRHREAQPQSFIVKYRDGATWTQGLGPGVNMTHSRWDKPFFNGFGAKLDEYALNIIRSDPNVEWIEEDGIVKTSDIVTAHRQPWGISRISQDKPQNQGSNPLSFEFDYTFNSSAGEGVDIYVIDTGINIDHVDFEGRAKWGKTFGPYTDADGDGHGTHCAGTAAGRKFGVAKNANLIAVKVLSDSGEGSTSDIISGMNFVLASAKNSSRPSVASMSLGGSVSASLDHAVTRLTDAGVHVVVAAGNEQEDADNSSPARAPSAITVGATDIADAMADFSNFGPAVNLFAPGVSITSDWIDNSTAINTISGTSMATPHVAGLVATLISSGGNLSPNDMSAKLQDLAVKNIISSIPDNTVNLLARNDLRRSNDSGPSCNLNAQP